LDALSAAGPVTSKAPSKRFAAAKAIARAVSSRVTSDIRPSPAGTASVPSVGSSHVDTKKSAKIEMRAKQTSMPDAASSASVSRWTLCHSTVDNSFSAGIGRRLDGHPNRNLNVGAIVALSPAVPTSLKTILNGWGPGKYDPRINFDGQNTPLVLPPAFGLRRVAKETFTAEGEVSYWNAYVAVTQMHGQGSFSDPRLGVNLVRSPDLVTSKLPALREYQFSLDAPAPPPGSFDVAAAARGQQVFNGAGRCSSCHLPEQQFTDINNNVLHLPSETGMNAAYAQRTTTKRYRTTPLRGLWQHPPYFHDGSAADVQAVVEHYNTTLALGLTAQQKTDLAQYLKSL
jgi:mono/diheme cytochrome c family protein